MAYHFPPDVEQFIKARLESGTYASEDEILRDAIGALERVEQDKLTAWDDRNRLAAEQSERGLSRPLDDLKVLARLRERLAKEGILD